MPPRPGVLQVRLERGLLAYPRGRSAMVRYLATADLQAAATELAVASPAAPWWCRVSEEALSTTEAEAACEALRESFERRFGASPGQGHAADDPGDASSPGT